MFRSFALVLTVVLCGCAQRPFDYQPIVDMRGVDPVQYRTDLDECSQYTEQVAVGPKVAAGAVTGAVLGAAVGAAVGNSDTAQGSAGAGAVIGGARGAGSGIRERNRVLRNCLRTRGYAVLN